MHVIRRVLIWSAFRTDDDTVSCSWLKSHLPRLIINSGDQFLKWFGAFQWTLNANVGAQFTFFFLLVNEFTSVEFFYRFDRKQSFFFSWNLHRWQSNLCHYKLILMVAIFMSVVIYFAVSFGFFSIVHD